VVLANPLLPRLLIPLPREVVVAQPRRTRVQQDEVRDELRPRSGEDGGEKVRFLERERGRPVNPQSGQYDDHIDEGLKRRDVVRRESLGTAVTTSIDYDDAREPGQAPEQPLARRLLPHNVDVR